MSLVKPTVVVVDDDDDTVVFLIDFLRMVGLAPVACPPGPQAPTCIAQHQPSVVILDIQMPGMDGITMFHHVRANPTTRTTPVIFFTGSAQTLKEHLPDYHARGAALVVKPNFQRLSALIQRFLP